VLYKTRAIVFLTVAPLWLILVLQYTGREGWLRWPLKAFLFAVPLATLVLIFTNEDHGLVWTYEEVREEGPLLLADFAYGTWFWVDFAYAALLALAGATLLVLMLIRSQRLYAKQSVSLLLGVAGPWFAYAAYMLGFDSGVGALPGLNPAVLTFPPAGLALAWGLYRYRLLDISPVAHDAVVEGMSDSTMVLDARGRIVDLNPSAARILRRGRELPGDDEQERQGGADARRPWGCSPPTLRGERASQRGDHARSRKRHPPLRPRPLWTLRWARKAHRSPRFLA